MIFLQNVVTDLLLGLEALRRCSRSSIDYVKERYGAEAGFITMNLPLLLDALDAGRRREPDRLRQHQQDRLPHEWRRRRLPATCSATRKCRAIAMSVLASGAIPPEEAIEWACGLEGLQSIVFGASSRGNIRQTKELIHGSWGR